MWDVANAAQVMRRAEHEGVGHLRAMQEDCGGTMVWQVGPVLASAAIRPRHCADAFPTRLYQRKAMHIVLIGL